jgi:hypothetical protein
MVQAWRSAFALPDAYFGFVQLSTFCPSSAESLPLMRNAQLAAADLPRVGWATNADHGAGCNVHQPWKQYVGKRLGDSALAIQYGQNLMWRSPSYKSAAVTVTRHGQAGDDVDSRWRQLTTTVSLNDVHSAGLDTTYPWNYVNGLNCTLQNAKVPGTCAWAAVKLSSGKWLNATLTSQGQTVSLTVIAKAPETVVATAYGWGPVPLMSIYDKGSGLPVVPWNCSLASSSDVFTRQQLKTDDTNDGFLQICSPHSWPANASHIQCAMDMGENGSSTASGSADGCAMTCCANPHCAVWQWAPAGSSGGSGCWLGHEQLHGCRNNSDWVGGSRVPPEAGPPPPPSPTPPPPPPPTPPPPLTLRFLSATFGDHMVLKRAPAQAVVFGHTEPGSTVTTRFDNRSLQTVADSSGTWRQRLPATLASPHKSYSLMFESSSSKAEKASLNDVLFGASIGLTCAWDAYAWDGWIAT